MNRTLIENPPELEGDINSEELTRRLISTLDISPVQTASGEYVLPQGEFPAGTKLGPYRIVQFIAAGGMAEVYLAQRENSNGNLSIPVALKVISATGTDRWKLLQRFKREAMITQSIHSPHVVRIYEYGELTSELSFLAMELLHGEELFDKLSRENTISPLELAELTVQILNGLRDVHEAGFVHRDIKPENIYLVYTPGKSVPQVKILDFGIAKSLSQASDPKLSVAGQIYGTPQYLAPEQANSPDVDPRADIYSLGVVLYECITGSRPFDHDSSYALVHAHQNDPIPSLPSYIDLELADIILQALQKDPDYRFQSAREMAMVLEKWIEESSWAEEFRSAEKTSFFAPAVQGWGVEEDTDPDLVHSLVDQVDLAASTMDGVGRGIPAPAEPLRIATQNPIPRPKPVYRPSPQPSTKRVKTESFSGERLEVDLDVVRQAPVRRDPSLLCVPPWEVNDQPASLGSHVITAAFGLALISSLIWAYLS